MSQPSVVKIPVIPPGLDPQTMAIIRALVDSIIQLEKIIKQHDARLTAGSL
jgi:hypothetical protein